MIELFLGMFVSGLLLIFFSIKKWSTLANIFTFIGGGLLLFFWYVLSNGKDTNE